MIRRMTTGFDSLMRKYTPDPFIYALILTAMVFLLSVTIMGAQVFTIASAFGKGFFSLATFTVQMVMVLFLGCVLAISPPSKRVLATLARLPKTLAIAAVYATLISLAGSLLNWGFGLIISALYCKELGKRFSGKSFHILVACSYSGFLVWHGGLSGSIPLVVSTPGNFSEALIGKTVPLSQTIFSPLNFAIVAAHCIFLPLLSYLLMKYCGDERVTIIKDHDINSAHASLSTPAEKWENSSIFNYFIVAIAAIYFVSCFVNRSFSFDLNQVNFILFMVALLAHKTPRGFLDACHTSSQKIWPILIQYPFYAAIMTIMQESGLAATISHFFVDVASAKTLPVLVYLSAGLINIFIPSGGGQWAVQGPMVIEAAQQLNANLNASMMAVAWGDAWTNMIQPFWALPVLLVAGLKAKDIMSSLVYVFLLSGVITTICFLSFI